jgi:hypothetical protein
MKKMITELYEKFFENFFENRYLNLDKFYDYTNVNYPDKIEIGRSTENRPIYLIKYGTGDKKILIWSQMHGNETTGTYAMFDLLNIFKGTSNHWVNEFLSEYQLHYIPVLNPDGAINWDRRNALGIDINRDFNAEQSEEIKVLKNQFTSVNYYLGFNLHDQRSIFSVDGFNLPATLSFLSPSIDLERSLNDVRKQSMGIISYLNDCLQMYISNQVARFTDEFYPNSTGDNFQKLNVPIVLFEAGHFPNDYERIQTRKYFCYSLYFAFEFIHKNKDWKLNYEKYFDIPENKDFYSDVLIKDVPFEVNNKIYKTDLLIQYKEEVNKEKSKLNFIPIIQEIGALQNKKTWKIIDGNIYKPLKKGVKIGDIFDFENLESI